MDALEAIFTRRSVREYKSGKIDNEKIKILLDAAMCAPSARNRQPWHFIVVADREVLNQIPNYHPYADMMKSASLAILVCGEVDSERYREYLPVDCSAATENLLLAARAIGLGAVWLGVYPRSKRMDGMRKLFNLPDTIIPISLISIGYPDEKQEKVYRYKEEKIHWNKWHKAR